MKIGISIRTLARFLSTSTHTQPHPPSEYIDTTACPKHLLPPPSDFFLDPHFLTKAEHDQLVQACDRKLRRLARGPYAEAHFDSVITGFKEACISSWGLAHTSQDPADAPVLHILNRMRSTINDHLQKCDAPKITDWVDPHILELRSENSGIDAHVDNLQASGLIVAGLCLISPAVMVFRHLKEKDVSIRALLPPGTLYFQRGSLRYDFTHEIPQSPDNHVFRGQFIPRGRRISVMLRDTLNERLV